MYDLILRGGRIFDPGRGIDIRADLAFSSSRISGFGEAIDSAGAVEVRQVDGCLVVPG